MTIDCLQDFVESRIGLSELMECLAGRVVFHFVDTNEREVKFNGQLARVGLQADHIYRQLGLYLTGERSAREVSDWAAAIRLLGCCDVMGPQKFVDSIWDTIDELMSPDVFGSLSMERALGLQAALANTGG